VADTPPAIQPGDAQAELTASDLMTSDRGSESLPALPLALLAIDVAGQIRERSPADSAIFGAEAGRLTDRFIDPLIGQELLARAATDGSADATAWLITPSGQQQFQVSLWRQRGGERIRLTAAFAAIQSRIDLTGADRTLARLSQDLRSPLAAAMGFAELIRGACNGGDRAEDCAPGTVSSHAASVIAAAWRIAGIADDLEAAARSSGRSPTPRLGEIPLARMLGRVARLAEPVARAAGVTVELDDREATDASVLGDDGMLWSVIDTLVHTALRHAGSGAKVHLTLRDEDEVLAVEVTDTGPGMAPEALAQALQDDAPGRGLGFCRQMARANGAELEVRSDPGNGVTARLCFPRSRVLNLP